MPGSVCRNDEISGGQDAGIEFSAGVSMPGTGGQDRWNEGSGCDGVNRDIMKKIILLLLVFFKCTFCNSQTSADFFKFGNDKADKGDFIGAILDYTRSIEIDPNLATAYFNRGHAKADLGDFRGAILDYDKGIMIDPNEAGAYQLRGYSKSNLGDYHGAIADYSALIFSVANG